MRGLPGGAYRCVSLATSTEPVTASISEVLRYGQPGIGPRPGARQKSAGLAARPAGGPAPAHRTARVISPTCSGQGGPVRCRRHG